MVTLFFNSLCGFQNFFPDAINNLSLLVHNVVVLNSCFADIKVVSLNFYIRKTTVEYDDVMNQQRQIIYGVRKKVLEASEGIKEKGNTGLKEDILEKVFQEIGNIVTTHTAEGLDAKKIVEEFSTIINFDPNSLTELEGQVTSQSSAESITEFLTKVARDLYEAREKQVGEEVARQMEGFVYLTTIDTLWIEHLDTMDDLRAGIGLRGYAQRDPLVEYKKEGYELFSKLVASIDSAIVHQIYKIAVQNQAPIQAPQPIMESQPDIEVGVAEEARELEREAAKVSLERDNSSPVIATPDSIW